jgi:hypothetical protein
MRTVILVILVVGLVAGFFGSAIGFAQNAPPIKFPAQIPETEEIQLHPLIGNADAQIVLDFIQKSRTMLDKSYVENQHLNPQRLFVGRHRIAPGPEDQILFLVHRGNDYLIFGNTGFALTKKGDDWVELGGIIGYGDGEISLIRFATQPIEARLYNDATYKHDIAIVVQPANDGYRTIVGSEFGYYWDGTSMALFCWWHECD